MGYSSIASSIRDKVSSLSAHKSVIDVLDFDGVWKGEAHDAQISSLDKTMSNISTEMNNLENFANLLDLVQNYKDKKDELESISSKLDSIPDIEENSSKRASLKNDITKLKSEISTLKSDISAKVSFSSVDTSIEVINYQYDVSSYDDFVYLFDYNNLMQMNRSGQLSLFNWEQGKETLYDYYDRKYVNDILLDIRSQYSGREAAVNCTLAMMQMAANVGKKLTYDGSLDIFDIGVKSDCAVFASWGVNMGTRYGDFDKKNVLNLYRSGTEYEYYEEALPGDVFVHFGADRGSYHATFLIENDRDNKVVTIAEAGGTSIGVRIRKMSYEELKDRSYRAVNMSQYYI